MSVLQNWNFEMVLDYDQKSTFLHQMVLLIKNARIGIQLVIITLQPNFSHTIYFICVCVNFIHFILFKVGSEQQSFEKLFVTILFTLRIFTRRKLLQKYFFIFCFDVEVYVGVWIVRSRLVSQQTIYFLYLKRTQDKNIWCGM